MTTPTTVKVQLKLRQDTSSGWSAVNPILLVGELGRESNTGKIKIGDGSTAWNSLTYQPFGALITNDDISATAEIAVSKLADGAARQILQTDAAGTGVEWASNIDIPGTLDVTGAATFDATVTVTGDLTVNGTTTTISTQNLLVEDKNIIIGDVATPTDTTADGGGITLKGATDKTINWIDATDAWTSSERFSIPLGSAAAPSLTINGDANSGLYSPGADQVAISTGGSGRLFVDASGNVILGTTSVLSGAGGRVLQIGNTSDAQSTLQFAATTAGNSQIQFGDGGSPGSYAGYLQYTHTDNVFAIGTASNERLRITSAGLVGIGTTSPGYLLQVSDKFAVDNSNTFGRIYLQRQTGTSLTAMYIQGADQANTASDLAIVNTSGGGSAIEIAGGTSLAAIKFFTNGATTERARIDFSGRFLVGTSTARSNLGGGAQSARLQIEGTTGDTARISQIQNANSSNAIQYIFAKSRGTTVGSNTIVQSGDGIGQLSFEGSDGTNFVQAASITGAVDGTPGTNDMPGRLVFSTTADGASSPTERMRIKANGVTCIGTSTEGTMSGDTVVAIGPNIGIISKSATGIATSGTVDISINTGGGGYQGFLVVSNTDAGNAAVRTHTTFSVFGRGTDSSIQQIATDNGTTSGASFTVTTPTNGVIRVTNTSAGSKTVNIQFFGGTST